MHGRQPGVITVEKKSHEEPQEDDSCSQATTAKGPTRPAALNGADSGKKIKKDRQKHRMCESGDPLGQGRT